MAEDDVGVAPLAAAGAPPPTPLPALQPAEAVAGNVAHADEDRLAPPTSGTPPVSAPAMSTPTASSPADAAVPPAAPAAGEAPAVARVVLHVGCGPASPHKLHRAFHKPGWREVRLDIDPRVAPDIVASITDMKVVPSASVDAVWSSHNLEHLEAFQVPIALGEFIRVLRPGGFLLITLPDLQTVAKYIVEDKLEDTMYVSPAGPIRPLDTLFGLASAIARGNGFMAHRTGFTAKTLGQALARAGFRQIRLQRQGFDLWAQGWKLPPAAPASSTVAPA